MKPYPKEVLEIHKEFFTAGDFLLKQAQDILKSENEKDVDKVNRLIKIGFINTGQATKSKNLLAELKINKDIADNIMYFKVKYPNNKFITEEQVTKICEKYNLVCAEISRFKGFVPDKNLKDIESFEFSNSDKMPNKIKITKAWGSGVGNTMGHKHGAKKLHKILGSEWIDATDKRIYYHGNRPFSILNTYIEEVEIVDRTSLLICAPKKDMDLKGLKNKGKFYFSFTVKEYPDPVVLKPVKGGFLIVSAWGDEASDELVVNQNFN